MNDLIERQAANDALRTCYDTETKDFDDGSVWINYDDAVANIEELPSAQPEIVRCKDCLMHRVCRFKLGLGENGFCSQAERRTNGSD